jgi:hypothetical protein
MAELCHSSDEDVMRRFGLDVASCTRRRRRGYPGRHARGNQAVHDDVRDVHLHAPAHPHGRLDALIERVEVRKDQTAVPDIAAHARGIEQLCARLEQVCASVGDIDASQAAERSVYEAVHAASQPRAFALAALSTAAASTLTPASESTMLRIFEAHPWNTARWHVGGDLVAASTSRATFERVMRAMEDPNPRMVWVRDVGTAAAIRIDPATAFDRLHTRFEQEFAKPNSYLIRGLCQALTKYGEPVDARWFPFLVRFLDGPDAVVVSSFLWAQPHPAAVEALAAFIRARTEANKTWAVYAGHTLIRWASAGRAAAPAVIQAAEAALNAGAADWRLTGPLDALLAMDDETTVPALRALVPKAKRKAKTTLEQAIAKLARNLPIDDVSPSTSKKRAKPGKPIDSPIAAHLDGFSDDRKREIIAIARHRIELAPKKMSRSTPPAIGTSRFGGEPDLPPGTRWPELRLTKRQAEAQLSQGLDATPHDIDGGKIVVPLGFACQLRLEEIAPFDVDKKLPSAGLLSFFVRQDIQPGEHGELFMCASCVLYFDETDTLVTTSPPANVADTDRYPARAMKPAAELPLPVPAFAYKLGLLNEESALYDAAFAKGVTSSPFGALGDGRAAYYQGLPKKGETLLLQLASGDGTQFQWGDASSIFFLISDAALKKRDFSKVVCVADEC